MISLESTEEFLKVVGVVTGSEPKLLPAVEMDVIVVLVIYARIRVS